MTGILTVPSEVSADFVARANLSAVVTRLASVDRRICNSIRTQRIRDTYIYCVHFFIDGQRFDLVVDALRVDYPSVESLVTEVALTYG